MDPKPNNRKGKNQSQTGKRANPNAKIKQGVSKCGKMISVRSCGFIVIKKTGNQPTAFLLMKQRNRYDLPKGHQEEGEDDLATAYRELWEETGIKKENTTIIPNFSFSSVYYPKYARFNRQTVEKTVIFYGCVVADDVEVTLEEHQGFEWRKWSPPNQISDSLDPLIRALEAYYEGKR